MEEDDKVHEVKEEAEDDEDEAEEEPVQAENPEDDDDDDDDSDDIEEEDEESLEMDDSRKRKAPELSPATKRTRALTKKSKPSPRIVSISGTVKTWSPQTRTVQVMVVIATSVGEKKAVVTMPESFIECRIEGTVYTFSPNRESEESIFPANGCLPHKFVIQNISGPRDLRIVNVGAELHALSFTRMFCLRMLLKAFPRLKYANGAPPIFKTMNTGVFPLPDGRITNVAQFKLFNNAEIFRACIALFGPYLRPPGYYVLRNILSPRAFAEMSEADVASTWAAMQTAEGRRGVVFVLCDPDDLVDISLVPEREDQFSEKISDEERRMTAEWREVCQFWHKNRRVVRSMHKYYDLKHDAGVIAASEATDIDLQGGGGEIQPLNSLFPSELCIFRTGLMDREAFIPSAIRKHYADICSALAGIHVEVVNGDLEDGIEAASRMFGDWMPRNKQTVVFAATRSLAHRVRTTSGRPVVCIPDRGQCTGLAAALAFVIGAEHVDSADFADISRTVKESGVKALVLCGVVGGASDAVGNVFRHIAADLGYANNTLPVHMASNVQNKSFGTENRLWQVLRQELAEPETTIVCGPGFEAAEVRRRVCERADVNIVRRGTVCTTADGERVVISEVCGMSVHGETVPMESVDFGDVLLQHVMHVKTATDSGPLRPWAESGLAIHAIVDVHRQRMLPDKRVVYIARDDNSMSSEIMTTLRYLGKQSVIVMTPSPHVLAPLPPPFASDGWFKGLRPATEPATEPAAANVIA